jgi:signal transduction histidine kinase
MKNTLHVLIVEDSENDAELVRRQLTVAGYEVVMRRVETEEDLRAALTEATWQLVVCDYRLPRLNALRALEVLQATELDLPFIVVSGLIGEEAAVDLLRRGAHDYMLKYNMARFVPAVQRELKEAEARRAHRAVEHQRQRAEEALRIAHDALEHRVAERTAELSAANERLKELDRLKSEFLATMSHELRTPLNSIIGFTGLVKEGMAGPVNDEQKKQLGMAYSAAKHLLALIADLLDLSKIDAGKVRLVSEPFDFAGVVAEVVAHLKPQAQAKLLQLRPQLPPGALPMHGDRKRCLQVLLNLVQNAVKFTDKGAIDLVARTDATTLRVDVIDTGIGIKPEELGSLFEAFRQLDGSARRRYEGAGLGLYLCRRLLTLMGGEITAYSVFGQGSRFSFHVPRRLAPDLLGSRPPFPPPPPHDESEAENSPG